MQSACSEKKAARFFNTFGREKIYYSCHMNATGVFVSHLIAFPRQNMKAHLSVGALAGTVAVCHRSWWIETDGYLHQMIQALCRLCRAFK